MMCVVIPPAAGLFSAIGLLFADVEHHCIRAYYRAFDGLDKKTYYLVRTNERDAAIDLALKSNRVLLTAREVNAKLRLHTFIRETKGKK